MFFSFGRSKTYSKSTHCVASASQPYIDAWQNAIPTPSFGAFLDNESLFIGVTFIIGLDVSVPHKCRCCAQIGKFGIQSLHRCSSAGRFPRHSGLNDAIKRCLGSAGFPCQLEPVSLGHLVPLQVSPNLGCYILYWYFLSRQLDSLSCYLQIRCSKIVKYSGLSDMFHFVKIETNKKKFLFKIS